MLRRWTPVSSTPAMSGTCHGPEVHLRKKNVKQSPADYLRAAQAYMLISMPTGTSTIFGAFQAILALLANGTNFPPSLPKLPRKPKFASEIFCDKPVGVAFATQK